MKIIELPGNLYHMVVLARQKGQLKKEIKKWKKDFQEPISD
jgi:hypothetical protein